MKPQYGKTLTLAALPAAILIAACDVQSPMGAADEAMAGPEAVAMAKGNNFPDGPHDYNLHIIGVPRDKSATMDGNNGHRIFVRLDSDGENTVTGGKNPGHGKGGNDDQNHIYLCNSSNDNGDSTDQRCTDYGNPDDWGVIDANATDGDGALLAVPDPCLEEDGSDDNDSTNGCEARWEVHARALAGGSAVITTCADEEIDYDNDGIKDTWCGENPTLPLSPRRGRKAVDVSSSLLYMTITVDDTYDPNLAGCIDPQGGDATDGEPDTYDVYLFDRCFEDYFWNYDNNGLKNLELRFYWTAAAD